MHAQLEVTGVEAGVYLLRYKAPEVPEGMMSSGKIRRRSLGKLRDLKAVLRRVLPEATLSQLPKLPAEGLLRKIANQNGAMDPACKMAKLAAKVLLSAVQNRKSENLLQRNSLIF